MTETKNSAALQWILGGALVLIGLFVLVALVSVRSQADSVSTSAGVTNVTPVVDSVYITNAANGRTAEYNDGTTAITLVPGATKEIHINGAVTDQNGVDTSYANGDLNDINVTFFRSDVSGGRNCTVDNNDCYKATACTLTGNTATQIYYDCTLNLAAYADSTSAGGPDSTKTWVASVQAIDDSTANNVNATVNTAEVGTLLSLVIPGTINYGTLTRAQETTTANNQEMTITQNGNDVADVEVSGTTMPCTVLGTVPIASQEWSLTDVVYSSGTDLTASAVDTNFAIGYRTIDATPLTKILYWNIGMPAAVTGTCSGTNTITAIAS
jgi:hypothetical protein